MPKRHVDSASKVRNEVDSKLGKDSSKRKPSERLSKSRKKYEAKHKRKEKKVEKANSTSSASSSSSSSSSSSTFPDSVMKAIQVSNEALEECKGTFEIGSAIARIILRGRTKTWCDSDLTIFAQLRQGNEVSIQRSKCWLYHNPSVTNFKRAIMNEEKVHVVPSSGTYKPLWDTFDFGPLPSPSISADAAARDSDISKAENSRPHDIIGPSNSSNQSSTTGIDISNGLSDGSMNFNDSFSKSKRSTDISENSEVSESDDQIAGENLINFGIFPNSTISKSRTARVAILTVDELEVSRNLQVLAQSSSRNEEASMSLKRISDITLSVYGLEMVPSLDGVAILAAYLSENLDKPLEGTMCSVIIAHLAKSSAESMEQCIKNQVHNNMAKLLQFVNRKEDAIELCDAIADMSRGSCASQRNAECKNILDGLLQVMKSYKDNLEVLTAAFSATGNVTEGRDKMQRVARKIGIIAFIVDAMSKNCSNTVLMEQSMVSLQQICIGNERNEKALCSLQVAAIIVEIMKLHPLELTLKLHACIILDVTISEGDKQEDVRSAVTKAILMSLHEIYIDNCKLEQFLTTLKIASSDSGPIYDMLAKHDGVQTLLSILLGDKIQFQNVSLVMAILANAAKTSKSVRNALQNGNAMKIAIDACESWSNKEDIVESSISIVLLLWTDGTRFNESLVKTKQDILQILRTIVRAYENNDKLQKNGRILISALDDLIVKERVSKQKQGGTEKLQQIFARKFSRSANFSKSKSRVSFHSDQ